MRGQGPKTLAGFTLMELMIAATVLVIALAGIIAAYTGCFNLNETARNLTIAMNIIQEKQEEIRNYNFGDIVTDYSAGGSQGDTFNPNPLDGSGRIDIIDDGSDSQGITSDDLLQITITVSWTQKGRRQLGEQVVTLLSRR